MHEDPEEGDIDVEEVCHGVGEGDVVELVGGNNRDDCIVVRWRWRLL